MNTHHYKKNKKRIVILGGGFAGVYAYLELHKYIHRHNIPLEITLVNNKDYFLFIPMLHEVATGNLIPQSIVHPLRFIPQCCLHNLVLGTVSSINLDTNTVTVKKNTSILGTERTEVSVAYDYLMSALGSAVHDFGVPGVHEHAYVLKTLNDARVIKNQLIELFERAEHASSKQLEDLLRIVIVGGGATGVELAGEFADIINHELKAAFPRLHEHAEVVLIHSRSELLPKADAWFRKRVHTILHNKHNVRCLLNTHVMQVYAGGVATKDKRMSAGMVVWTSGVKATSCALQSVQPLERDLRTERIKVRNTLQLPYYDNVFIAGDQAWIKDKETGQPYPMRAQFAVREGQLAARNIIQHIQGKPLKEFEWKDQGFIVSLGKGGALAKLYGVPFSGPFAWWVYRTAYLFKLIGWRTRLRTALEWTINLFTHRDISKL